MIRTALSFGVLFTALLAGSKWLHQSQVSSGDSAQPTAQRVPDEAPSEGPIAKPMTLGESTGAIEMRESDVRLVAFDEPLEVDGYVMPVGATGRVADDD